MKKFYCLLFVAYVLNSCGAYFNQPISQQEARTGETTSFSKRLKNLPLPEKPVVVGVYNFRDQTGQYKNLELGSSFSTAVTQGATSVLVKALEDSRWFTPIEREGLNNLLNERNIIRSTRQEYSGGQNAQLPPLLYAGVLLEGGIVSYDSNILTGGMGARYFGAGGSTQYRQDRITIYLRAVSTSNGRILKTVYVSKTILSQAVDASLFRYVNFQKLLEVETGFTKNEPVQLAVKEAVEKAVESLIIEGVQDNLWQVQNKEEGQKMIDAYNTEKEEEELTKLYNREFLDRENKNSIGLSVGTNRLSGDFRNKKLGFLGKIGYTRKFTPYVGLSLSGSIMEFRTGRDYENLFASTDLNLELNLLPHDKLDPYLYGGVGYLMNLEDAEIGADEEIDNQNSSFFKLQYGAGLKYAVSERIDFKLFAEHNLSFSDEVDGFENGKYDDHYFNFGIGLNYNFGRKWGKSGKMETIEENPIEEVLSAEELN